MMAEPREYVRSHGKTAKDVMTRHVITAGLFASIAELASLLETNNIKRVPIVDAGKLAGIVARANIIQSLVAMEDDHLPKAAPSDQKIREALLNEFADRAWAHKSGLNVIVNKGVVRYWGYVGSEDARDALRVDAENVPGVKSVEDNLGVSTMPARPYILGAPGIVVANGINFADYAEVPAEGLLRRRYPQLANSRIALFLSRLNFKKASTC